MMYHHKGIRVGVTVVTMVAFFFLGTIQVGAQQQDNTCTVGTPLSGGTSHCSSNAQGSMSTSGYTWTIWSSGGGGCIITYKEGCAFKATWNNSGDFLARAGLQWNSTKTHDQIGTISTDFAFTKSGTGGGYSYIGIYGWSKNPLREYYIVEDWFSRPMPGSKVGTITVDDGSYDVYKNTRVNQPSIEGTSTFDQFFSVRKTARQCGHISISQHFDEWAKLGLTLGKMYEAKVLVEAGGGSGSVDFTKATVDLNKPVSVLAPGASWQKRSSFENLNENGVLSVVSLNGTVLRSERLNGSKSAVISTDNLKSGVYFLQFRGDSKALVTRTLLLK